MATLFFALLAGGGAEWLVRRVRAFSGGAAALPALVGVVLVIGVVGEGAGHMAHPVVPQPARAEIGLPGPLLDLPTDGAHDRVWQYFSTDGFYEIPIGNSTFDMPAVDDLRGGMSGFPDRASVEKLRYYGIRTVVLHTQPLQAASRSRTASSSPSLPTRPPRPPNRSRAWASRAGASARSSSTRSAPGRRRCTDTTDAHEQAPGTRRDPARRPRLRDDDPELLLEPDLPLRPDPLARTTTARRSTPTRKTPATRPSTRATGTRRAPPAWRCSRCPSTTR